MLSPKNLGILVVLVCCFSCGIEKNGIAESRSSSSNSQSEIESSVKIDSVSIAEMQWMFIDDGGLPSIFDYYKEETTGEYSTWSKKLFGRCCSNTDLSFTENLFFKITSNLTDGNSSSNVSDTEYLTAFSFKPESNVRLSLELDFENSFLDGENSNRNLLSSDEIIMSPVRLSLINGNVQSEELFRKNGRVKGLEVYINDEYKQTVTLLDVPEVQEFSVDVVFKTNDRIVLVPKTFYSGDESPEISISEIQTNLGKTALPSLNEKFNLSELMNGN